MEDNKVVSIMNGLKLATKSELLDLLKFILNSNHESSELTIKSYFSIQYAIMDLAKIKLVDRLDYLNDQEN